MAKKNTAKKRDPNSLRSKRRNKRNFTGSRPNRRATLRLNRRLGGWQAENPVSGIQQKKPGSTNHW